jgi:predicted amidohydrolase YtcJ
MELMPVGGKRQKVSLEPGKLADLVIVSQDPFHTPVLQIGKAEVLLTMVGGKVVYQSPASGSAITVSL